MLKQLDTLIGFVVVMAIVSLLITIITQMVSSFLGLRGKNLADALEVMIRKISPEIGQTERKLLIRKILTNPATSDSILSMENPPQFFGKWKPAWWQWLTDRWSLASAIRPDELLGILKDMAAQKVSSSAVVVQPTAPSALPAGRTLDESRQSAERALEIEIAAMKSTANKLLSALQKPDSATAPALVALEQSLPTLLGTKGPAVIQDYLAATNTTLNNLEKWFNSAQDRAQQWFAMHTRIVTICASIVTAFLLQLDTIQLFKEVSSDADLRDKLVTAGLGSAFQTQASNVISGATADKIDSATHREIVSALLAQSKYHDLPATLATHNAFSSLTEADSSLEKDITDPLVSSSFVADYNQLIQQKRLNTLGATLTEITKISQKAGFQLLPDPYPDFFNTNWPQPHRYSILAGKWSWPKRHLLGILLSAGLLSLGAPFWFNTLKSLANLRPVLANEVDKDPKQLSANPPAKAT